MKTIHMIAWILIMIGGLNWLLTGLFPGWNLGMYLGDMLARIVYILVGLSAIYEIATHKASCRACSTQGGVTR